MALDPITLAKLWMVVKPVRLIRNRRRAKRGLPPITDQEVIVPKTVEVIVDGEKRVRTEPIIQARSSTKSLWAAGGGLAATLLSGWAYYPEINHFLTEACRAATEEGGDVLRLLIVLGVGAAGVSIPQYITSRMTKTPMSISAKPVEAPAPAEQAP